MKILLTNFHPYNGGGHTTYLLYLYRELNKNKEVFLSCPETSRLYKFAQDIKKEHVVSIDFPGKIKEIKGIAKNLAKVVNLMRRESFDLIHVNGSPDHRMIMYAKILLNDKTPVIKTIHNSLIPKTDFFARLQRRYFTDKIIVVSNFQKGFLLNNGYKDEEIEVIHNGIDTDYFSFTPVNKKLRVKYKIKDDDIVFVSTAGTSLHKGWHILVEAVSNLDSSLRNRIKIILAGEIPDKKIQETYIEKFDMSRQVIFTGLLPDVREVVSIADIGFVLSYKIETISFACREMMSMGRPVIVSDYAGLTENIDDGINGWIVKPCDVNSVYSKINEIILNIDNLDKYSAAARQKAEREFVLNKFITKTLSCYESVLKNI